MIALGCMSYVAVNYLPDPPSWLPYRLVTADVAALAEADASVSGCGPCKQISIASAKSAHCNGNMLLMASAHCEHNVEHRVLIHTLHAVLILGSFESSCAAGCRRGGSCGGGSADRHRQGSLRHKILVLVLAKPPQ